MSSSISRRVRDDADVTHSGELPTVPCPVCQNCDHDIRSVILELNENVVQNVKDCFETLVGGMESDGDGASEFIDATRQLVSIQYQLSLVLEVIPTIAMAKQVGSQQ